MTFVFRYDAVTVEGKLAWQDALTSLNYPFFAASDGIFINYTWRFDSLQQSTKLLESFGVLERKFDVYFGCDVFGRGTYGGGKEHCYKAAEAVASRGFSLALFAPGWILENGVTEKARSINDFFREYIICSNSILQSLAAIWRAYPTLTDSTSFESLSRRHSNNQKMLSNHTDLIYCSKKSSYSLPLLISYSPGMGKFVFVEGCRYFHPHASKESCHILPSEDESSTYYYDLSIQNAPWNASVLEKSFSSMISLGNSVPLCPVVVRSMNATRTNSTNQVNVSCNFDIGFCGSASLQLLGNLVSSSKTSHLSSPSHVINGISVPCLSIDQSLSNYRSLCGRLSTPMFEIGHQCRPLCVRMVVACQNYCGISLLLTLRHRTTNTGNSIHHILLLDPKMTTDQTNGNLPLVNMKKSKSSQSFKFTASKRVKSLPFLTFDNQIAAFSCCHNEDINAPEVSMPDQEKIRESLTRIMTKDSMLDSHDAIKALNRDEVSKGLFHKLVRWNQREYLLSPVFLQGNVCM